MASRQKQFVERIYQAARNIGLGEPQARLAASQAALETAYGKSVKGNNYFGIKAGSSWKGATQSFKTWEEVNGKRQNITDKFRKYDTPEQSLLDWAGLMERRYPDVLKAKTFEEAKQGLRYGKRGGYATDSKYGSKLGYIESRFMPDAQPDTQVAEADLPVPNTRPTGLLASAEPQGFDQGGILAPETAGSFSPIGAAQASPAMPAGILAIDAMSKPNQSVDMPPLATLPDTAPPVPSPPQDINQAGILGPVTGAPDMTQAPINAEMLSLPPSAPVIQQPQINAPMLSLPQSAPPMPNSAPQSVAQPQGLPDDQFDARFSGLPPAPAAPQPNAVTPQNVAAYQQLANTMDQVGLQGIGATQAIPGSPPAISSLPMQQPMQAPQMPMQAPQAPMAQAPMQVNQPAFDPNDPFGVNSQPYTDPNAGFSQNSGMDVWQGRAMQGTASDGTQLSRARNGDVYRYNPEFDHTQRIGPDGSAIGGVMQGRVNGPIENGGGIGLKMPSMPNGLGMPRIQPAQTRAGNAVRGVGGAMAGGLLGSFLGGPAGGLLAAAVGRNLAQGKGILGGRQIVQPSSQLNQQGLYPQRPDRPVGGSGINGFGSQEQFERARSISPATASAIASGKAGLY